MSDFLRRFGQGAFWVFQGLAAITVSVLVGGLVGVGIHPLLGIAIGLMTLGGMFRAMDNP
jgi:hypothetical protein